MKKYSRAAEWVGLADLESTYNEHELDDEQELDEDDEQIPVYNRELHTLSDCADYLNWLSESDDPEGAHCEADDTLLKVIGLVADTATESVATTLRAIVANYKEVPKYYA